MSFLILIGIVNAETDNNLTKLINLATTFDALLLSPNDLAISVFL
jgi:hypothetical protein